MEPILLLLAAELAVLCSLLDSSSIITLLSAADGIVGKNLCTFSLGELDVMSLTASSCTACCRTKRGFAIIIDDLPVNIVLIEFGYFFELFPFSFDFFKSNECIEYKRFG